MPVMRSVKNIVKNYTDAEVKVREATSNDPWGPSSTLMSEIADLTYNVVAFTEIMQMVWKRLNDHGKNWRHVYKSLTLLEYIMKTGSEKVAQQCKENIFAIQTLKDFQHLEDNKDLGANVREKAKGLVALLKDDERLKNERAKALKAKERFTENFGIGSDSTSTQLGRPRHKPASEAQLSPPGSSSLANPDLEEARPHSIGEEELQLQLALAMSKEEAETDAKKKTNDDLKLQLALEESKKDEQAKDEHLLDFAGGAASAAAAAPSTNDPWNPASSTQAADVSDSWLMSGGGGGAGAVSSSSGFAGPSPFSPVPASAGNDPWLSTPAPPLAAAVPTSSATINPWDIPAPAATTVITNDPWTSEVPVAGSASLWDAPATNGNTHKPVSLDDDFEALTKRTTPSAISNIPASLSMGADVNGTDLFSMGTMQGSLPLMQPGSKKPEDFLDPTAKNLVNLDSLVTKPQSSTGIINPFAMTGVGANGPHGTTIASNPFAAQQPVRPSLNQMSTSTQLSGFGSAPPLNPMMPGPIPQNTGFPLQQQPMYQQPAGYNMNNPFL